jgi:hypothetical protein
MACIATLVWMRVKADLREGPAGHSSGAVGPIATAICGALGRASVNSDAANQRSPNPCRPFPVNRRRTLRFHPDLIGIWDFG